MADNFHAKQLVKILIGAALSDGQIQPEEREYLHKLAKEKGVADDAEIQLLLFEFKKVEPKQCYEWINEYLGDRSTLEDYQQLVEAVTALIYLDGKVEMAEARLLTKIKLLNPANRSSDSGINSVFKAVQQLYQRWLTFEE